MKKLLIVFLFLVYFFLNNHPPAFAQSCTCVVVGSNCELIPASTGGCPQNFSPQIIMCNNSGVIQNCFCTCSPSSAPVTSGSITQDTPLSLQYPGSDNECLQTALGCFPTNPKPLTEYILKYAVAAGGGLAFLLSLWGGITIILSAGNPEKIKKGQELISSAILGILFIALSVFLLRFISVDILKIPGFSK